MKQTVRLVEAVNEVRTQRGYSYEELSEATGMHRVTLSRLLNKHVKSVTLDDAVALAKFCDLSLDEVCNLISAENAA